MSSTRAHRQRRLLPAATSPARSDSVDVSDERHDELRVPNAHAQASPLTRRRAHVSGVVAARSRVVLDRRVLPLIAAARYRKTGGRLPLVDRRLDDAVRRRARCSGLETVVVETSEVGTSTQTPCRT